MFSPNETQFNILITDRCFRVVADRIENSQRSRWKRVIGRKRYFSFFRQNIARLLTFMMKDIAWNQKRKTISFSLLRKKNFSWFYLEHKSNGLHHHPEYWHDPNRFCLVDSKQKNQNKRFPESSFILKLQLKLVDKTH